MSYVENIEEQTVSNENFRQVVYTGKYLQLVLMSLKPGEDIGMEVHPDVDQFFRRDQGQGKIIINGQETEVTDGFAIVVPAGAEHNLINTSTNQELKLYTIYAPPNHPDSTVHHSREEAMAYEQEHHSE